MVKDAYAIVIGISRYPDLKDLEGPLNDAENFCRWLQDTGRAAHVEKVLSDAAPKPGDRPIQHEIDQAFAKVFRLARANSATRRLYVYFAGHGCSATVNHIALVMANASKDTLNNAIDAPNYHEGLATKALFQEQFMFYDCCRNFDRRVYGRRSPWSDEDPTPAAAGVKQFILYGAAFTQYANERAIEYSERRGLFTKALLEGLGGYAARRRQGKWVVTTASLTGYVAPRLRYLASRFRLRQDASLGAAPTTPLEITEVEPKFIDVTVTGPDDGAEVVVRDSDLHEVERGTVTNRQATFKLTAGSYSFVVANDESRSSTQDVQPEPAMVVRL